MSHIKTTDVEDCSYRPLRDIFPKQLSIGGVNVSAGLVNREIPFSFSEAYCKTEGRITGSAAHGITHAIRGTSTISISY